MATITTTYQGDMLFESQLGNHKVQIDVPANMGGSDRGPTPPELFVASLGSCVGAFAATYCRQAGIDTADMTVDVSFDKVGNPTRLTNLAITVNLPYGDCSGREKALLRVAEHCPVHETISMLEGINIQFNGKHEAALAL
ncbi:MAG: OsmC family protein, partial [Caldilineaceae bacterium]|nr:OsmC family protein [Caldilineaceae bacterium]